MHYLIIHSDTVYVYENLRRSFLASNCVSLTQLLNVTEFLKYDCLFYITSGIYIQFNLTTPLQFVQIYMYTHEYIIVNKIHIITYDVPSTIVNSVVIIQYNS